MRTTLLIVVLMAGCGHTKADGDVETDLEHDGADSATDGLEMEDPSPDEIEDGLDAATDTPLDPDAIEDAPTDAAEVPDTAEDVVDDYVRGSLDACLLDPACHRVGVTSHMGAWTAAIPGNSMAAYISAWTLGADAIEADVRVSADGVPFMIHNDEIQFYESALCTGRVVSESEAADIDGCLLLPSLTETIPTFEEFVTWARGKIIIHLDVKDAENIAVMVQQIIAHGAQDFVFIAVSPGEAATIVPTIPDQDQVYFVLRVGSVTDIDAALSTLRRPNIFMLEGDRAWDSPAVSETEMLDQIVRVQADGLRIMASSDQYLPSIADHTHLYDMGFDLILSYNCANGVEAARLENISRGYEP